MKASLSRRNFLRLLGLGTAVAVTACKRGEDTAAPATTAVPAVESPPAAAADDLPFSVWEELRAAVRAAPDHLPAQADAVVASGDPEAIFAFVRDRISVLPPAADGFRRAVTARRWGTRGTLRCGWGTPRERADLLAELYARAGLQAEVVEGALVPEARVGDLLRPRTDLSFAPPVDEDTLRRWHRQLDIAAPMGRTDPDPNGELAVALADRLLAALGPVPAATTFDSAPPERVPLVRVMVDGSERFANPLLPDAPFGDSRVQSPVKALGGEGLGELRVALSCARSVDPSARMVLAEARWPLEEAVGARVIARFVPSGDFTALFTTPLDFIPAFTALLALDDPWREVADLAESAVVGDSISVHGDRFQAAPGGEIHVGEAAVGGNPAAPAAVASLTASVSAQAFPSLFLTVAAWDASGAPVPDAPAEAFAVSEDGAALSFVLTASHAPPPSVLLLFDGSRSLPRAFLDEGMPTLARSLAEAVLADHPAARFRLGGVNYGTASISPAWLASAADVAAEAARVIADGSELWSALGDARRAGATVIVLVTDGQASDPPERVAAARPWVHAGPPVVVVGVGAYDAAIGEDIARTSGGAAVPVADHAGAVAAVLQYLEDETARPYRLATRALPDGPAQRQISIRLGAAETRVEYAVPTPAARLAPPVLSGLYLSVGVGNREVLRTLAGIPWEEATPTTPVTPELAESVRLALTGGAELSIEAGPPTASVWLDDFLTAKLSLRALFAARNADIVRQVAALAAGVRSVPPQLPALQGPVPSRESAGGGPPLLFPSRPHAVLLTARPVPGGTQLRRADLLPIAAWSSLGEPHEAFAETLRRTATCAVREAGLYGDSTLARLEGRALEVLPPAMPARRDGVNARWARLLESYTEYHRIVPADAGAFAFWAVDRQGSLLGILPDGSGGGSATDDIAGQCEAVGRLAAGTQLAGGGAGLGLAFAGFVSLQKAISLQALRAAAVIATLENPKVPPACDKGLGDLGCDLAKDTLASVPWSGYGAIDTADDIAEASGAGGLVDC